MSIINEALKKAGKDRQNDMSRPPIEIGTYERKKAGFNWGPVFVLLVLALIAGPILIPVFSTPFKKAAPTTSFKATPAHQVPVDGTHPAAAVPAPMMAASNRRAQFGIEESALSLNARVPNLALTGIVFAGDGQSYSIINNQVLKVGDHVQGATLTAIAADMVTVEYRGQSFTVPVSE